MKSVLRLNRAGEHHFSSYHHNHIDAKKQLLSELIQTSDTRVTKSSLARTQNATEVLQLSEIYSLIFPRILRAISLYPFTYKERGQILNAMNVHSISLSQLRTLKKSVSSELTRLLIFASRALVNYYIPNTPFADDMVTVLEGIRLPGDPAATDDSHSWFDEDYPWLVKYWKNQTFGHHGYWAIYMSYLYEVLFDFGHKEMGIPSLTCAFKHEKICNDVDLQKRNNLKYMVEKYGLIVWSRDKINALRLEFIQNHNYPFFLYVLEGQRINKILFVDGEDDMFVHGFRVMTRFILDLAYKHNLNLGVNISNTAHVKALGKALSFIEAFRFGNHGMSDYKSFVLLSELILRVGQVTKNELLLIGCLAQSQVDKGYINATFRMFQAHYPLTSTADLKDILLGMIIGRSRARYSSDRNIYGSLGEIIKLAQDPLFSPDTLALLAEEVDQDYAYTMIKQLCKQRQDWRFQNVLAATPSRKIAQMMVSMILFGEPV